MRPDYWRLRPELVRGAVVVPKSLGRQDFYSWCNHPAIARIYIRTESDKLGSARAGLLPDPGLGPQLFEQYAKAGESLTMLLNGVERTSELARRVRSALPDGPDWRADDDVATLSTLDSGIGFHAGHEDGFIVQVSGSRRWRVWASDVLTEDYRYFLLGRGNNEYSVVPDRPNIEPVVDVDLNPGDALYVPALFPHEGITTAESISFSIAWRGLSPYSIVRNHCDQEAFERLLTLAEDRADSVYRLLGEPDDELDPASSIVSEVDQAIGLESIGVDAEELVRGMRARVDQRVRL